GDALRRRLARDWWARRPDLELPRHRDRRDRPRIPVALHWSAPPLSPQRRLGLLELVADRLPLRCRCLRGRGIARPALSGLGGRLHLGPLRHRPGPDRSRRAVAVGLALLAARSPDRRGAGHPGRLEDGGRRVWPSPDARVENPSLSRASTRA